MSAPASLFAPRLARRRLVGGVFTALCLVFSLFALVVLAMLLTRVFAEGWRYITPHFFTNPPSDLNPELAGIKVAIIGSVLLIGLTALVAVPVGIGAAVYLEEYARHGRLSRFIALNIANLAGVPSIVYGILGLAVFVRWLALGRSVVSGALTMALLALPVIIIASREAIGAVPSSLREAAYGLGATRWQVVRYHVMPAALPGMMTGIILALSRAIGEAAPLILVGAATYVFQAPQGLGDAFTVLPIQIFNWAEKPDPEFHGLAAGAIIVLLGVLLTMNAAAIGIRAWQQNQKLS